MNGKFTDFKEFSRNTRVPYPGERQAPEEAVMAEHVNMAQMLNKINDIAGESSEIHKLIVEAQRANESRWLDLRGIMKDLELRVTALSEGLTKLDGSGLIKKELEEASPRKLNKGLQNAVLAVFQLSPEEELSTHEITKKLRVLEPEHCWSDPSIASCIINLHTAGKTKKIRRGIYKFNGGVDGSIN